MEVFLNGEFVDVREARISVLDHGFLYGDGIYETLRTYGGKFFQMREHMERFVESARVLDLLDGIGGEPFDKLRVFEGVEEIFARAQELVERNGFGEATAKARRSARVRITLTRGENGYTFVGAKNPTVLIQADGLVPVADEVYEKGVTAMTFEGRRFLPQVKSVSLLPMVMARAAAERAGVFEAFFVGGKGEVLEGATSNIFVVFNGVLVTPREGILPGTVRNLVLDLAQGLPGDRVINERKVLLSELYAADEVFLTSSVKGIVPVVVIDGRVIGDGKPGEVTGLLWKRFTDYVDGLVGDGASMAAVHKI